MSLRALAACLSALVLFYLAAANAAPITPGNPLVAPILVPPCNCSDDAPAFIRALATGRPVYAQRGKTYNITTGIAATSNGELHLAGATLVSNVTSYAVGHPCASTWPAAICAGYISNGTVALAANATVGASTFTTTTVGALAVGSYVQFFQASVPEWAQTFTVQSIAGSSNPYTVTVGGGKTMAWAYPAVSTTVYAAPTLVTGFHLYGEGATINVASTAEARGIQLQGCQECKVSDVTVTGWPQQTCFSWDLGGTHNEVSGIVCSPSYLQVTNCANNGSGLVRLTTSSTAALVTPSGQTGVQATVQGVTGCTGANGVQTLTVVDGTHVDLQGSTFGGSGGATVGEALTTEEGLKSEACERCTYRDIAVQGAAAGFDPFCSIHSLYDKITVSAPCSAGITLGGNGIYGSIGSELREPIVTGCRGYGIIESDAERNWRIAGGRVENVALDAVNLVTSTSGAPDGTVIDGLSISSTLSGNGLHFTNATNTLVRALTSNITASALLYEVGSGSVTVDGATITGGATPILIKGGTLATKHTLSGVTVTAFTGTALQTSYGTSSSYLFDLSVFGFKVVNAGTGPFVGAYIGHAGSANFYGLNIDFTGAASNTTGGYAIEHAGTTGGTLGIFGGNVLGSMQYGVVAAQNGAVCKTVNLNLAASGGAASTYGGSTVTPVGITYQ